MHGLDIGRNYIERQVLEHTNINITLTLWFRSIATSMKLCDS